jgi:hypothetical protein
VGSISRRKPAFLALHPAAREILSEFCWLRHDFSVQLQLAGVRCGPLAKPLAIAFLAELDFTS